MYEGPHLPMTIMPLVEENRRLHEENQLLKRQLEVQAVQWDQWLDQNVEPNLRSSLATVRIDVSVLEFLSTGSNQHKNSILANKLLNALVNVVPHSMQILRPAHPLLHPDIHSSFTFTFLGLKK